MRILVLTSAVPYPPHGGGHIRMYAILRHLSRKHTVDLVSLVRPGDEMHRRALQQFCREVVFLAAPRREGLRRLAQSLKNLVLLRDAEADPEIAAVVAQRLARGYDLVQVENGYMIPYVAAARGIPKILDIFGLGVSGVARDLAAQPTQLGRARALVHWLKAKRVERRLSRLFDAVYVVSEADRAYLAAIDRRLKIYVVPNGVDTDYFVPRPGPEPPPAHIVFTGAMDYRANEDAALFFHREMYPRILRSLPDVRLWLVGRDPSPRVAALARDSRIVVTGAVEDVRPYLVRASVVVVPMRLGAGTRIKVLEALSMAKPVVSTSVGTEGLEVVAGRHYVAADDPEAFAAAVVRLVGDPVERWRLGAEGRALVEADYDWRVALAPLRQAVAETAKPGLSQACRR